MLLGIRMNIFMLGGEIEKEKFNDSYAPFLPQKRAS
jgi:hypothetical protein